MKGMVTPPMSVIRVYFSVLSRDSKTGDKRSTVYNVDQVTDGDIRFCICADHELTVNDSNVYLEYGDPARPDFITYKESWRQGLLRARAILLNDAGVAPNLIDLAATGIAQMNQGEGGGPRSPPRGQTGKSHNYLVKLTLKRGIPGPLIPDLRRNVRPEENEFGFEV